eukprot:gnl/TRDRNA2_/TRDRNA2_155224_c1_seq2.p1 gnl/TRDRNA2_/TRDRNA2_155224_c1~~gnl/TRDRNA2_/TRDRNA2_155224_c1_seq2.p1  ORF type:complete len:144 (+),score=21.56 gnl/TRDRNA2_/TRDRNA2_155224_c1_seq2:65-496(+)
MEKALRDRLAENRLDVRARALAENGVLSLEDVLRISEADLDRMRFTVVDKKKFSVLQKSIRASRAPFGSKPVGSWSEGGLPSPRSFTRHAAETRTVSHRDDAASLITTSSRESDSGEDDCAEVRRHKYRQERLMSIAQTRKLK